MARNFKTGVTVTGDAKGAVSAMNLTSKGLGDLNKKAKDTGSSFKNFSKSMVDGLGKAAATAAKYGSIVATAAATATAAMVRSGLSSVDALAKTSDSLGIATEELARLRFAAQQTGVAQGEFDKSLEQMTRRLGEATQGTGTAKRGLDALGLSAQAVAKMSPDEAFRQISESIKGVEDRTRQASIAYDIFGRSGVKLLNTLDLGADGLAEMAAQADAAGLSINRMDAAKIEAANDAMARVRSMFTGLSQQLAVKFAPILEGIADRMFGIAAEAGGAAKATDKAFSYMVKSAGFVADAFAGISRVGATIGVVAIEGAKITLKALDRIARFVQYVPHVWIAAKLLGLVKGEDVSYNGSAINKFITDLEVDAKGAYDYLAEIWMKPLPSDGIKKFVDESQRAFEAQAITAARSSAAMVDSLEEVSVTATRVAKEDLTALTEAAKREADGVAVAYERGIERMDDGFADFFKTILRDGKVTFDNLKNIFLDTLAEMIYAAARNKILLAVGVGGGSTSALAAGGSTLGGAGNALSVGSALKGGWGAVNTALFDGFQNTANFFHANNMSGVGTGINNLQAGFAQQGGQFGVAGGMAVTAGAGIAGGWAGTKAGESLFGKEAGSAWGASAGAAFGAYAGSVIPVIGTALGAGVGGFVGGLADALLGSSGNKQGGVALTLGNNTRETHGKTASTQFTAELGDQLEKFAEFIGGSNAMIGITAGNKSGLELSKMIDGEWVSESFKNASDLMDEAFDWIIRDAKNLAPIVRDLALAFEGSGEELAKYTVSVQGLWSQSMTNPVIAAAEQMDRASMTATQAYRDQMSAISDMVRNFDGSTGAVQNLSMAMAQNQEMAFQMAVAIRQVSDQITGMGESSARAIRESVMSASELRVARLEQRNELTQSLRTAEDPGQLASALDEVLRLNNQIFQSMGDPSKAQAEAFANYAERAEQITQNRLENMRKDLQVSQGEQNAEVRNLLVDAAGQQQHAADTMLDAAITFQQVVAQLQAAGIPIRVGGEITA